jgi:hypothetical protein
MAAGSYIPANSSADAPLAERWNGKHWALSPVSQPAQGFLRAVSCPAIHTCVAVGNPGAIAERWNGTTWTPQPVPLPNGSTGGDLYGISCRSPNLCTAVGDFGANAGAIFSLAGRYP